jgi:hypothetical protein
MTRRGRACRHDQAATGRAREGRDGTLDLLGVAHVDGADLHPERRCRGLDDGKLAVSGSLRSIPKDRHSRHARCGLLEQFQPFRADVPVE